MSEHESIELKPFYTMSSVVLGKAKRDVTGI